MLPALSQFPHHCKDVVYAGLGGAEREENGHPPFYALVLLRMTLFHRIWQGFGIYHQLNRQERAGDRFLLRKMRSWWQLPFSLQAWQTSLEMGIPGVRTLLLGEWLWWRWSRCSQIRDLFFSPPSISFQLASSSTLLPLPGGGGLFIWWGLVILKNNWITVQLAGLGELYTCGVPIWQ